MSDQPRGSIPAPAVPTAEQEPVLDAYLDMSEYQALRLRQAKPAPAVPEDVTEIVADLRQSSFATAYDCAKYADIIEALATELTYWCADSAAAWDKCEELRLAQEKTEAELARLRNALRDILDAGGQYGSAAHMANVDRIARAALHPTGGST